MKKNPVIIGIAGRSCSGKSTLAQQLHKSLGKDSVHINVDDFFLLSADFKCKMPTAEESLAIQNIYTELFKLKNSQPANFSIFDCRKKRKLDKPTKFYRPTKFVIVEGTLILWDKNTRDILDLKIFIDAPNDSCLQRRIKRESRDIPEGTEKYINIRNRVLERWKIISEQWDSHLESTSQYADILTNQPEEDLEKVLSTLRNKFLLD